MTNNYWNKKGLHQKDADYLNSLMPDMCYTDNKYMNAFIAMSKLYYDVYNNGGGNIPNEYYEDDDGEETSQINYYGIGEKCQDYIRAAGIDITVNKIIDNYTYPDHKYLESKMDEVIKFLSDKDLNYTKYVVWVNHDLKRISNVETIADGFKPLVFGEEKEMNDWVKSFTTASHLMYSLIS